MPDDRRKEMPAKQMSPSFPPFSLDLMRFTPCIMLIWWELDRGSHKQMRVMMRQDLTNQKPKPKTKTMTRQFENLSHWFDEILVEDRGLMDKWYIDATKLFLLAALPNTPLQMTIKTQKSSGQSHYFLRIVSLHCKTSKGRLSVPLSMIFWKSSKGGRGGHFWSKKFCCKIFSIIDANLGGSFPFQKNS